MTDLLQSLLSGTVMASVYVLVGFSWNVVHNTSGYLNLVLGQVFVAGALLLWTAQERWPGAPYLLHALGVLVLLAAAAWIVERLLLRRVQGDHLRPLIVTLGLAMVIAQLSRRWVPEIAVRPTPLLDGAPWRLGGVVVGRQEVVVVVVAVTVATALAGTFALTDVGRRFRACADDRASAVSLGIDVARVATAAFVLSIVVAGIAGIAVSPVTGVAPGGGELLAIKAFLAVSVGGIGRYGRGAVAAVAVGLTEALVARYWSAAARDLIVLAAFIVALWIGATAASPAGRMRLAGRTRSSRPAPDRSGAAVAERPLVP